MGISIFYLANFAQPLCPAIKSGQAKLTKLNSLSTGEVFALALLVFIWLRLPVKKISTLMKRTVGALRQKARVLGIRLGHRR